MTTHQEPAYEELKQRLAEAQAIIEESARLRIEELNEALQKSDDNFRNIMDACPLGVGIMAINGNIIYANRALLDIYGYDDIEEFKKLPLEKRQTPESYTELRKQRDKAHKGEPVPPSLYIDIVRKNGEIRHCETFYTEITWEGSRQLIVLYQDVTDSKWAKEALQESEEKFSVAFRSSPNMCIIVNLNNGQYVEVNDRFVQITGYSREELTGRTKDDINMWVKTEDEEKMVRLLQEPGKVRNEEFDFRIKSGEVRTWLCSVDIINIGGEPCMLAIASDITERKRANQLQRGENYILTLLGQGTGLSEQMDAIVRLGETYDPSIRGSVLLYDSSKGRLFPSSAKNLPEKYKELFKDGSPVGPDTGSCGTAAYRKERVIVPDIKSSPFFLPYEDVIQAATDNNLLASWAQPIIASNGDLLGVIANYSDKVGEPTENNLRILEWSARIAAIAIEHKHSEEALRKSEDKFSRAFRSSPDRIAITTLKEGRFVEVNDSYLRFTGYTREEVIGHIGKELNSWVEPEQRSRIIETIKKQGQVYNEEVKLRIKSGEIFTSLFSAETIDIDGEPCLISIATDITERQRAEEKLRANENFLQNIFHGFQDGISVLDTDLNIVRTNSWTEKMYQGQMPLVGKKCYQAYWERSTPCPWCPSIPAIKTGKVCTEIVSYPSSGNDTTWIEISSFPMKDDDGRVTGIIEHLSDITERKIMEEKLEKERRESKLIIDSSPIIIFYKDSEGKFVRVNKAHSDALNMPEEEFIGKTVFDLYSVKIAQKMTDDDHEVFKSGKPKLNILEQYESARGLRWVITDKIPILNQEGMPNGLIGFCQDITERIQAEQSLANEAIRRRILIEQSRDGIVVLDENGKVYESNQRFAEMLGYTMEEVRHLSVWDWGIPGPRERVIEMIRTIDESGDQFETKHIRKDGTVYDVEISTNGAFFAGQKLIFCVCRDITGRKRAEKELRDKAILLDSITEAIITAELDFTILTWNGAAEELYGWSSGEVIGKKMGQVVPTEFINDERDAVVKHFMKTGNWKGEVIQKDRDNRDIYVYSSVIMIKDADDQPVSIMAINRDISERKQAEETLRESEQKYSRLVENGNDGILIIQEGIVEYANPKIIEMTGYSLEQGIGKPFIEFISPEDRALVADIYQRGLAGEKDLGKFEFSIITTDGRKVEVESSASSFEYHGKRANMAIIRDITERKRLEEEQQRADKLESIGTLAGGIAHDFNNLLTGIMGNIGLAKKYINTEEKAYERLEEAEKASVRARDLTQQLLTFARGGLPVKKPSTISELIAETAAFVLRGSNVRLSLSFPDDLWIAEVDEGQIGQVINNLIINADEAMPSGGVINISGSNVVLKSRGDLPLLAGKYVRIDIKDEGIGISKEHLKRVFEPYFTTKQKGSGLGLATVYSIIKNHGGYISVESKQNKGTTFHILLPAFGKALPKKKEVVKNAQYRGGGKILVMDDEKIVRDMLGQLLTDAGYQVESVDDGVAAIRQYSIAKNTGKPFDAVILDLTVPGGMGGEEAVSSLLKIDPEAKVIVSSGYATDPIMAKYKEYGFSAVVTKPYSVTNLEKTLHALLKKKK